jgi:hypothetical protein
MAPRPAAQGWRSRHGRMVIPARLPDDLFKEIANYAARHGLSFNRALIALAGRGLDAERRWQQRRSRRWVVSQAEAILRTRQC